MKISVCIISFNEEENIRQAIESVSWADEVVVVDSESSDQTCEIASSLGATVIIQKWLGFGQQKQLAVDACRNDWILSLDADERVSDELRKKILQLKNVPETDLAKGYKIPRLTFYMNRPIRYGGWYPDWQLRFFNRRFGAWKDMVVHESVQMNNGARVEKLKENILHLSIQEPSEHNHMISVRYAPLAAEQMFANGYRTSKLKIFTVGLVTFFRTYILLLGFLDGFAGFCIARFAAHNAFMKHLILWEKQNREKTSHSLQPTNKLNSSKL